MKNEGTLYYALANIEPTRGDCTMDYRDVNDPRGPGRCGRAESRFAGWALTDKMVLAPIFTCSKHRDKKHVPEEQWRPWRK